LLIELRLTAVECRLPYGITQCYLPPTELKTPALTPAIQAGTRFTYHGGMDRLVDLGF